MVRGCCGTHSLCRTAQRHLPPPRLVPLAACGEPGLGPVHGAAASSLLAVAGPRKEGLWVAGTAFRVEADSLQVLRSGPSQREVHFVAFALGRAKGAHQHTWTVWREQGQFLSVSSKRRSVGTTQSPADTYRRGPGCRAVLGSAPSALWRSLQQQDPHQQPLTG